MSIYDDGTYIFEIIINGRDPVDGFCFCTLIKGLNPMAKEFMNNNMHNLHLDLHSQWITGTDNKINTIAYKAKNLPENT